MMADFVILSVATQRVTRRKPQQKIYKDKRKLAIFGYFAALSMTKFINITKIRIHQYDKQTLVILSLLQKRRKIHTLNLWILHFATQSSV